jgi:Family of unknown function (DUF6119)/short chain dehydrogenase
VSGEPAGKVGIITSAATGIGKAIAIAMAAVGGRVVVNHLNTPDRAEAVVAQITGDGGEAIAADVSKRTEYMALVDAAFERFGSWDILVKNAGIAVVKPFAEISEEEFDKSFVVNVKGCFKQLLAAYGAEDYKERFAWIDQLRRVRDPSLIDRLNETLLQALRARELTDMHLAPPEPMPWSRLAGFTFSTRGEDELDTDPRISGYLDTVDSLEDLDLGDLKKHRVVAISADTDQALEDWSVHRCLVFDVREGDVLYALTAGQWYSVSTSFADEVLRFAADLPELDLALPGAAAGVREEDYNRDAAQVVGALCLDQ